MIEGGIVQGSTDDVGFNVAADPVHIRDFQATILRCLSVDHPRLKESAN